MHLRLGGCLYAIIGGVLNSFSFAGEKYLNVV